MNAGVRELKANLSRYLKRVRDGATVSVTDRGRVVATLQPVAVPPAPGWARQLVAEGRAQWNGGKPRGLDAPVRLRGRGMSASASIVADRR